MSSFLEIPKDVSDELRRLGDSLSALEMGVGDWSYLKIGEIGENAVAEQLKLFKSRIDYLIVTLQLF